MKENIIPSIPLVIASSNVHKIQEFKSILSSLSFLDILSLKDFPHYTPIEETGLSFEENAKAKAIHAAKALKLWVLADDSGLVIPALHGEPGIFSRRYAGASATDLDNRKKLLEKMQHLQGQERFGFYECAVALASPDGILKKCVNGICEGEIVSKERGRGGFGYDSLFLKHEYNKTFGELDASIKNRISHRRKALDKMMTTLESLTK